MAIKHVIIHEIQRYKDGALPQKTLRDKENSTAGMTSQLTDGLMELFANANLSIGEFGVNGDNSVEPVFEQKLKLFYPSNDTSSCSNFVGLSQSLAEYYEQIIIKDKLKSVKGGYLVFYQYQKSGDDWLAVTILNKTNGIDVQKNLSLVASEILDLKKLHLGAAINLSQWKDGLSSRYVRFRTGLASEVRDYFEEFIGCQRDKLAAKIETKNLKDAIQDFCRSKCNLDEEQTSVKILQAHDFIKGQQSLGMEISLSHVANRVFPDNSEAFSIYAKEHHELPEELVIDSQILKRFKKISGRGKGISISFDRELLDTTVSYSNGTLTFSEIPDTLKQAIEEDIKDRARDQENEEELDRRLEEA